jgi:hypothetical protein
MIGLQSAFSAQPNGGTALIGTLRQIYNDKINCASKDRKLLIIVVTDGEPTDGTRTDLYNTLVEITRYGNVHVSFAECTDNAEDMEYLDAWDGCIKNFDNTDDYREELQRVKMVQGMQFKFDYTDYVIKILLATFVRWYFSLDQIKVYDPRNNSTTGTVNPAYGSNQFQTQYSNPVYPPVQTIYTPQVQPYTVPSTVPWGQPYTVPSTLPSGQQYTVSTTGPSGQQYTMPSTGPPGQQYTVSTTGPSGQQYTMPSTGPSGQQYTMPSTVPWGQPYSVPSTGPSGQQYTMPSTGQQYTVPSTFSYK